MPLYNPVPAQLVTATGDIVQGTSAGVLERLGIGSAGQILVPISGKLAPRTPASFQLSHANPTLTASASQVMMGMGDTWTITPNSTGRIFIVITFTAFNDTLTDGGNAQIYTGTGVAPVNGAAASGTQRGANQSFISSTVNGYHTMTLPAMVSGLTLGTAYWMDVAVNRLLGGNVQLVACTASALEF